MIFQSTVTDALHEAPLSLFRQAIIRLVDFMSPSRRTERKGEVHRKNGGQERQPCCHPLICRGCEICSLSFPYALHNHLIFLHLHIRISPKVERSKPQSTRPGVCLLFCLYRSKRKVQGQSGTGRENYKTCSPHSFQFNCCISMSCFDKEFGPQCSTQFPTMGWLMAWRLE